MTAVKDRTPWIVVTHRGCECRRCRAVEKLEAPVPISTFMARGRAFVAAHKSCTEIVRQPQGSGLPMACQFGDTSPPHPPRFILWSESAGGLRSSAALCGGHADRYTDKLREQGGTLVSVEDVDAIEGVG